MALLSMAMWSAYGGPTGAHAILWANPHYQPEAAIILSVKLTSARKIFAVGGLDP